MRFHEVDVFGTGPFLGNPLAVVHDPDGSLSTEQMQRIAAWTAFSETTFLLPPTLPGADYRVRILTPSEELPFAGHPTLGTAHVWLDGRRPGPGETVVQECGAGLVPVRAAESAGGEPVLAFATPPRVRTGPLDADLVERLCAALGIDPGEVVAHEWGVNGPQWAMLRLTDADAVRAVRGSLHGTGLKCGLVGLEAEPAPGGPLYEVRGLLDDGEDPVTGSLNAAVAQWFRSEGLVPERYTAAQGSRVGRRGLVHVEDDGERLWVGGATVTRVVGELVVDCGDTEVARLVPVGPPVERELGFLELDLPDSFFDDLPPEELDAWDGRA